MFVLRCFDIFRGVHVALHLADDGEGVDTPLLAFVQIGSQFRDLIQLLLLFGLVGFHGRSSCVFS